MSSCGLANGVHHMASWIERLPLFSSGLGFTHWPMDKMPCLNVLQVVAWRLAAGGLDPQRTVKGYWFQAKSGSEAVYREKKMVTTYESTKLFVFRVGGQEILTHMKPPLIQVQLIHSFWWTALDGNKTSGGQLVVPVCQWAIEFPCKLMDVDPELTAQYAVVQQSCWSNSNRWWLCPHGWLNTYHSW